MAAKRPGGARPLSDGGGGGSVGGLSIVLAAESGPLTPDSAARTMRTLNSATSRGASGSLRAQGWSGGGRKRPGHSNPAPGRGQNDDQRHPGQKLERVLILS